MGSRTGVATADLSQIFPANRSPAGYAIFYHSHCQQRTCNSATQTVDVLRAAGFDVVTSSVECCGMAGSFGYKREYYELSMAVGEDLFAQVRAPSRRRPANPGGEWDFVPRTIVGGNGTRGFSSCGIAGQHPGLMRPAIRSGTLICRKTGLGGACDYYWLRRSQKLIYLTCIYKLKI